jgi:hypothetical protein
MSTCIFPELRPALERVLDETLASGGMTMHNPKRREYLLCRLQEQFERFLLYRLLIALPPVSRQHFASLIEHDASDEDLKAFAGRHIFDIPDFVEQVFRDFCKQRVNLTE